MSRSTEEQRPLVDGDGDACSSDATPEPPVTVPKTVTLVLAACCMVESDAVELRAPALL